MRRDDNAGVAEATADAAVSVGPLASAPAAREAASVRFLAEVLHADEAEPVLPSALASNLTSPLMVHCISSYSLAWVLLNSSYGVVNGVHLVLVGKVSCLGRRQSSSSSLLPTESGILDGKSTGSSSKTE